MFHICSNDGVVFSGTLEQLRKVEATKKSSAHDDFDEVLQDQLNDETPKKPFNINKRAVEQYRDMLDKSSLPQPIYHAYQVMTQPVAVVNQNVTVGDAIKLFYQSPFEALPIINDRAILVGMLQKSELLRIYHEHDDKDEIRNKLLSHLNQDMFADVITADPVTDIRRIAAAFIEFKIDKAPVVDKSGKLIGIITRTDILKCIIQDPPLSLWS